MEWLNFLAFGLIILIIVGGGVWLIYQSINPSSPATQYQLPSIKENWEVFESQALAWKNDSYLFGIEYEISKEPLLTAKYESPSDLDTEFIITKNQNEQPVGKPLDLGFEAKFSKPIGLQDFSIDTQQALEIMLKDQTASNCMVSDNVLKQLSLEADMTGYPVWALSLANCPERGRVKTIYLNAQTGIVFDPTVE